MPRKSRIDTPGALHHIIARRIERRSIFDDDHDRDDFLKRLGTVLQLPNRKQEIPTDPHLQKEF